MEKKRSFGSERSRERERARKLNFLARRPQPPQKKTLSLSLLPTGRRPRTRRGPRGGRFPSLGLFLRDLRGRVAGHRDRRLARHGGEGGRGPRRRPRRRRVPRRNRRPRRPERRPQRREDEDEDCQEGHIGARDVHGGAQDWRQGRRQGNGQADEEDGALADDGRARCRRRRRGGGASRGRGRGRKGGRHHRSHRSDHVPFFPLVRRSQRRPPLQGARARRLRRGDLFPRAPESAGAPPADDSGQEQQQQQRRRRSRRRRERRRYRRRRGEGGPGAPGRSLALHFCARPRLGGEGEEEDGGGKKPPRRRLVFSRRGKTRQKRRRRKL